MFIKYCRSQRSKQYSSELYCIGSAPLYSDYHDLDGRDHDDIDVNPSTVQKFYRIEIHNSFYYCNKYKRATTTNNHTVLYQDQDESKNFSSK